MKSLFVVAAVVTFLGVGANRQTPDAAVTPNGVIGEVSSIDMAAKKITVKAGASADIMVILDENTQYLQVPPGEKTLERAIRIMLANVSVGDRVFARGKVRDDRKAISARSVIVMKKGDILRKQAHDRAEWRRRSIAGVVTAVNSETKEVMLLARTPEGPRSIVKLAAGDVRFRRYAPDSVKFSDAKPSSLAELKVGDQLRALGEKSADGTRFTAEEIVSGSFRTIGGAITAVDPELNQIKVNDADSRKPVTIVVSKDSMLRRIPQEMAAALARRENDETRKVDPHAGSTDFQEMLESLPATAMAELKPGEMILVSGTTGAGPSRITAIVAVTGVSILFNSAESGKSGKRSGSKLETIDFGVGLP